MRIIRLSKVDPDMRNLNLLHDYFNRKLNKRSPKGKFNFTKRKIKLGGLHSGELMVFTYKARIVYLSKAKSGVLVNRDKRISEHYPYYFKVDMDCLEQGKGKIQSFIADLFDKGVIPKIIGSSPAWPSIDESGNKRAIKKVLDKYKIY